MIVQTKTVSFTTELLEAIHNFSAGGDTFKIALYTALATLNATTTGYTSANEVVGSGYTAGGKALTISTTPTFSGTTSFVSFANAVWSGAALTARGALIYNSSKSNRSVMVLDFGSDITSTALTGFSVTFPTAMAGTAILQIS